MKLRDLFAAVDPYLHGRSDHAAAVRALWGGAAPAVDAERLAIYERFCRVHRAEALDPIFDRTRAAILDGAGDGGWSEIVEGYFRAHPMHHVELHENGALLSAFLAGRAGLPPWIAELADLEWWVWRTRVAPDGDDGPVGPLRIASSVELRPYRHDLVGWLDERDEDERRSRPPTPRDHLVLFWRGRDLQPRRERAEPEELLLLKLLSEGRPASDALAAGLSLARLEALLDDLRGAAILVGG